MRANSIKEVVKAVHHKEAKEFLESIIRLEKFEREITCYVCGTKITPNNIKALTRKSGKILFCCDNPECYRRLVETIKE